MSDETKTTDAPTDNAPEVTPTEPAQTPPQADGPAAEPPAAGAADVVAKTEDTPASPAAAGGTFTGGGEGKAPEARVGGRPPRGGQSGGQRGDRGRGRGRGRGRDEGADDGIESNVIRIYRCSKVVKGGRTFSFAALVVAGDRAGSVGIGYGKANEVPSAVEKATKEARRTMKKIPMVGTTIPHPALGASGTSRVQLIPANPGTGVTAGKTVRPLLELAGVTDVLTKAYGSTSPKNLLKATIDALRQLRSADQVKQMRGVDLPESAGTLTVAS
ncbi:MAG: 30S ribosomal protein S5 [Planctomycetota bacterium]